MKENKTVIITGASRGIGRETAALFAQKGYNVVANYNNSENEAKSLLAQLSDYRVSIFKADVSNKKETDLMCEFAIGKYGKIDALVNNAGISFEACLFADTKREDWDKVYGTNVFGVFNCVQSVMPYMIHEKNGSIVNVSSIWGITGASCEALYSSSKAAVIGFTKAMAKELAPSGIRVNALAPGVIKTEMNDFLSQEEKDALSGEIPLGRWGMPIEVADSIYFLTENSSYITGQVLTVDGGFIGI